MPESKLQEIMTAIDAAGTDLARAEWRDLLQEIRGECQMRLEAADDDDKNDAAEEIDDDEDFDEVEKKTDPFDDIPF